MHTIFPVFLAAVQSLSIIEPPVYFVGKVFFLQTLHLVFFPKVFYVVVVKNFISVIQSTMLQKIGDL